MTQQEIGHEISSALISPGEKVGVPVSKLRAGLHGQLLCYPGSSLSSFSARTRQLKELGISALILEGKSKVGSLGVVGKGCVSVVVKAKLRSNQSRRARDEIVALKIRRVDANRPSMARDFELQKLANSFGVGPRAISATDDLFAMEYIDSLKIGKWFRSLKTRSSKKFVRRLIRDLLNQCFILDKHFLDHGELSNPSKHVLIRKEESQIVPKAVIIDYESASTQRRPSNLTSVAQFFFLGNLQSWKVRRILGIQNSSDKKLIGLLREYKERVSSSTFENLMEYVRC